MRHAAALGGLGRGGVVGKGGEGRLVPPALREVPDAARQGVIDGAQVPPGEGRAVGARVGTRRGVVERGAEGPGALFRTVYDFDGSPIGDPGTAHLQGVVGFRVEYLDDDGAWRREWDESGLPRAVRVSLTLMDPIRPETQIARKAVFPIQTRTGGIGE